MGGLKYTELSYHSCRQDKYRILAKIQSIFNINGIGITAYKKQLKGICEKWDGAEDFINARIDKICSHEKLSAE